MKWYEVQSALGAGNKVRQTTWKEGEYIERAIIDGEKKNVKIKLNDVYYPSVWDIDRADNWEIISDLPKVKIFQSKDTYYECPKCSRTDEIIVYSEDIKNKETLRECRFCGQKFNITNLDEFYNKNEEVPKTNLKGAEHFLNLLNEIEPSTYTIKLDLETPWNVVSYGSVKNSSDVDIKQNQIPEIKLKNGLNQFKCPYCENQFNFRTNSKVSSVTICGGCSNYIKLTPPDENGENKQLTKYKEWLKKEIEEAKNDMISHSNNKLFHEAIDFQIRDFTLRLCLESLEFMEREE